jgi:fermentation-respiration switch protein FrsA (DUF1100 family)
VITTLVALAAGYLVLVGLAFAFQDRLLFQPSSAILATPDRAGMDYESVRVGTEDGEELHGWWIPARGGEEAARGTLLFFHGNAGNISGRLESVQQFHHLGLNVFIFDYRGYGESSGSPGEDGLYRDADAAWQYLVGTRGLSPSDVVLFARSMGGGPATWLATRTDPRAVILESVFTSVPDIAAHHYPFLPARALARIQFDNLDRVGDLGAPLLVIHSRGDRVVPFEHGRRLYEAASEPKQFLEIEGGHNDGFLVSSDRYLRAIDGFLGEAEL